MLERAKKSLDGGVKRVKWFASFLAERTRVETSMARLLYESSKLEDKLNDLYRDIGKRVIELKEKGERTVLKDFIILQAMEDIKNLKEQIEDFKEKAQALNKPSETL